MLPTATTSTESPRKDREPSETDPVLTPQQVARILGVHPFTVARHIDQGVLQGFKTAGGHRRLRTSEVRRFLIAQGMPIPTELAGGGPIRVLAVDDEPAVLNALRRSFKPHAAVLALTTTCSPIEALLMVGLSLPDVLLFDLQMPDLHGIELCMRVRETPALRGVRLVAMTGFARSDVMAAVVRAGAEVCLEKPVMVEMLLAQIAPQVLRRG